MTLPSRPILIAAAAAAVLIAGSLILMTGGSSLSAADRRIVDRMEAAFDICYADDLATLDRAAGCLEGKRLREETEARGLCRNFTGEDTGYRGISKCDG